MASWTLRSSAAQSSCFSSIAFPWSSSRFGGLRIFTFSGRPKNAAVKGLPFTLLPLVAGWWGIPWGPIYTSQSVHNNSCGGKDVTQAVVNSLRAQATPAQGASPIPSKS